MADIIWRDMDKIARRNITGLVFNSELNFDYQIYNIANSIYEEEDCRIVLLCGPSGSGKTTSCNLLAERLEFMGVKVHRISTDDFFLDRDLIPYLPSGVQDFDSIDALDIAKLQSVVQELLAGHSVTLPRFDFISGKSYSDGEYVEMQPTDVVIIEGIHAMNPIVLATCDDIEGKVKRIYIAPRRSFRMENGDVLDPHNLRLLRRLIRDYYTRGHSFEKTVKQWVEVRRAEDTYVYPYVVNADYNIDSVYDYELFVYKKCIYKALKNTEVDALQLLRRVLSEVADLPIASIPTTSLLNEFALIGDLAR